MAIASLRAGGRARAVSDLAQVRRLKLDSETDRATAFWLAYAQNANGATDAARTLWTWLVSRYPYSYYGGRAADILGISLPAPPMAAYFGSHLERPATRLPDDFWQLAYPRAYWAEVSIAAARHHVDPLLMIALARQESHFERTVKSPVGAIGLFQIMPYTAVR